MMPMNRDINLMRQPALVPLFGGMDKRPRALDREVITIGRARGCDMGLDAPEISTLHCILYRSPDGYRVRDCGSRTGTRVNGGLPRSGVLVEGDVLQIGPFSFRVKIPPGSLLDSKNFGAARLEHWQHSRQKLAQLALGYRRRLRTQALDAGCHQQAEHQQAELKQKAAEVREKIRQYDQRFNQLELAERDLEADRDKLNAERESASQACADRGSWPRGTPR